MPNDWAMERAQKAIAPILKERINNTMMPKDYDAAWDAIAEALRQVVRECADALNESAEDYATIAKAAFLRDSPESAQWHREVAQEIRAHAQMLRAKFTVE